MRYRPPKSDTAMLITGFVLLLFVVAFFDRPPFFDEDDYLANVAILERYGFGKKYLLQLVGSAGPLFSMVHYLFKPLTHLEAPYVRFVNIFFLAGVIFFTTRTLRVLTASRYYGLYVMAIPMTYVCGGLALTEMPAMFFFTLSIFLVIKTTAESAPQMPFFNLVIAGLCMGLAIIGRQPYLLTLLAFPILFFNKKELKKGVLPLAVFLFFSLLLPLYVFCTWRGLVAPTDGLYYANIAKNGHAIRVDFAFYCLAYFAVTMFLLSSEFYKKIKWTGFAALSFAFITLSIIDFYVGVIGFLPSRSLMEKTIQVPIVLEGIEALFGVGIFFSSFYFLVTVARRLTEVAYKKEVLFCVATLLLIGAGCAKITWGFSSRYAAQAIPVLVVLGSFFYKNSKFNPLKIIAGAITGLVCLVFYFFIE